MSLFLGIDTSNYTTSAAVCGDENISVRKIIDVKEGERGIRQSDGVFVHLKELPRLYESIGADLTKTAAVGVSTRPRSVEGSYMRGAANFWKANLRRCISRAVRPKF